MSSVPVLVVSNSSPPPPLRGTFLERRSVAALLADTTDAALELLRAQQPRLVLVDGAGTDALRRVSRLSSASGAAPVVALAGGASLAEEQSLRDAGARAVLAGTLDRALWDRDSASWPE